MSYQSITSKPCQVDDQHSPQNKTQAALLQGLPFRGAPVKKDTLYHPTKIPPSLTALVIVSLSDNTGPHLFLFLLELLTLTAPTWNGDLNFSKWGPNGDLILSEMGTKWGPSATEMGTKWGLSPHLVP